MDPIDPTQSTDQTPGVSDIDLPQPGSEQPQTKPKSGAEKRIDELTAAMHEQRRQNEQLQATISQMMAVQAQALNAQRPADTRAPPPTLDVPIPEGMDPAQAKFFQDLTKTFNTALDHRTKQLEEAVNRVAGQTTQTVDQLEYQRLAESTPREVMDLANKLLQDWRRNGYSGWKSADAIDHAYGILARQGKLPGGRPTPGGAETPYAPMGGGAPPPSPRQTTLPPPMPDAVIAKMPPAKQEEYWAKRLMAQNNGNIDIPIINIPGETLG